MCTGVVELVAGDGVPLRTTFLSPSASRYALGGCRGRPDQKDVGKEWDPGALTVAHFFGETARHHAAAAYMI